MSTLPYATFAQLKYLEKKDIKKEGRHYSHLELPKPKDGFPWERKPEAYEGNPR